MQCCCIDVVALAQKGILYSRTLKNGGPDLQTLPCLFSVTHLNRATKMDTESKNYPRV